MSLRGIEWSTMYCVMMGNGTTASTLKVRQKWNHAKGRCWAERKPRRVGALSGSVRFI